MDYPNSFFVPDDRLHAFVNDETYEFSTLEIIEDIEQAYPGVDPNALKLPLDSTILDLADVVLRSSTHPRESSRE